jgi:hypothetical protein
MKQLGVSSVDHAPPKRAAGFSLGSEVRADKTVTTACGESRSAAESEERERQKKLDDAYKAATKKIPDQKSNDPWPVVRPAPTTAPNQR